MTDTPNTAIEPVPAASLEAVAAIEQSDALTLLRAAANHLALLAEQYRGDPYATGSAVVYVEALMSDLRAILSDLKAMTAEVLPFRERLVIPGVGVIERSSEGGKDRWDDAATMQRIIEHERAAGRINNPQDVPAALLKYAAVNYWRKTPMRAESIPLDDLVERVTPARPSVKIVSRSIQPTTQESDHAHERGSTDDT